MEAPAQESWVSAARPPPTPASAVLSPCGASVVPFVEMLLHKALLNCLELGPVSLWKNPRFGVFRKFAKGC